MMYKVLDDAGNVQDELELPAEVAIGLAADLPKGWTVTSPNGVVGKTTKPKAKPKPKTARPIHHTELRHGIWGFGGPATVGTRVRLNNEPVIMKHQDGTDRPTCKKCEGS
jgi:hypothetical protein